MATLDTSDRSQIAAFGELEERRRAVLLQLEKTAENAAVTLQQYAYMVAAITSEGSIGAVWPDAEDDHAGYVAVFGASIGGALAALAAVVEAAWAVRDAGAAVGLAVLPGLPGRIGK